MNKKAYVKTIEAVIALVLSFLFITYFIPTKTQTEERQPNLDIIDVLSQDTIFRSCALSEDYSCMNSTFEDYYPNFINNYNYRFNVSADPGVIGTDLPAANVHGESLMIAGNDTYIFPKTVRLFYWLK